MDAASLVFTIISALFGGMQTYLTSLPYLSKKESFRETAKALEKVPDLSRSLAVVDGGSDAYRDVQEHQKNILDMLALGHVILAGFKRKLAARSVSLFACSLGLSGFMYIDLGSSNDLVRGWAERTELWDLGISALAMFLPRIASRWIDRIVMPHEWRFVRALFVIEQAYYRVIVEPRMVTFYKDTEAFFKPYAEQYDREMKYMMGKPSDFDPRALAKRRNEHGEERKTSNLVLPPPP